ncbi:hypothetical protein [Pseudomonas sp. AOB-7]|uniref:hypothetical protein n=1 Tax=Pseudomonas sp. AOB-7 TaxID=2482750 RepID=UPI0011C3C634|nr:hypothetical protein [Pseudomonas sp. AOB-7]
MTPVDIASIASAIFAGMSALVAAAAIYFPWRSQQSQEILNQAVHSLERAYESLSNSGEQVSPPAPSRLNWLTAARHIEQYKALKKKITSKTHSIVCEEHEEYWRHRFYLCLDIPNIQQPSYYAERHEPQRQLGIEPRSAIIIYHFASWPDGRPDPIGSANIEEMLQDGRLLNGNPGLRHYLNGFQQYRTET